MLRRRSRILERHPAIRALAAVLIAASSPAALAGQAGNEPPRTVTVAVGLSFDGPADVNQRPKCTELGLPCISPKTFPDAGIAAQLTVPLWWWLEATGDASVYLNAWDSAGVSHELENHVGALLAGPRLETPARRLVWYRDTTRYRVFAQFLAGRETSTILPARLALQPGLGVDGKLAWPNAWFRLEWDYRSTRGSPRNLSGARLLGGLAFDVPRG